MTIAPNGQTVADYDPQGVGAIVMAAISPSSAVAAGYATTIDLGDVVAGNYLSPSSSNSNTSSGNTGDVQVAGTTLPGNWQCLGSITQINVSGYTRFSTLWMRVS